MWEGGRRGGVLAPGTELVIQREPIEGTAQRISTTLPELIDKTKKGERLSMDDGRIRLEVVRARPPKEIACRVLVGGYLKSSKGLNLPETDLSDLVPALTEKDRRDVEWIVGQDIDYVALSFVQQAREIDELRKILAAGGSYGPDRRQVRETQALKNIEANRPCERRGAGRSRRHGRDMDLPQVPVVQNAFSKLSASGCGKCCIVATQMFESMIENASPTRDEVSDVANAVFEGADAVMLSGETAGASIRSKLVQEMMNAVCARVEHYLSDEHEDCVQHSGTGTRRDGGGMIKAVHHIVHADRYLGGGGLQRGGYHRKAAGQDAPRGAHLGSDAEPAGDAASLLFYGVHAEQTKKPNHSRDVLRMGRSARPGPELGKEGR